MTKPIINEQSKRIKERLGDVILASLDGDPSAAVMQVARQFVKDFPPEGAGVGAAEPEGVLKQYQQKITDLGLDVHRAA